MDALLTKKDLDIKFELLASKEDITNFKTDLIKWIFFFWVAQNITTFGLLLLFFKK